MKSKGSSFDSSVDGDGYVRNGELSPEEESKDDLMESSEELEIIGKRKRSNIILLIKRVINGPLAGNDSFINEDIEDLKNSSLKNSSQNKQNQKILSNNTSL